MKLNARKMMFAGMVALLALPTGALAKDPYMKTVYDKRGNPVTTSTGKCVVHMRWMGEDGYTCNPEAVREAVTVYFEFDKSRLTKDAKARLESFVAAVGGSEGIASASIIGYADRIGDANYNMSLSERRALQVAKYLKARGVIDAQVTEIRAMGETKPSTTCEGGFSKALVACLQEDRRVDVEIEFYSKR